MKKICLFAFAGMVAVLFTGCFSTHTNDLAKDTDVTLRTPNYQMEVQTGKKRVSGKASQNVVYLFLGSISWGDSKFADRAFTDGNSSLLSFFPDPVEQVKQAATYNACAAAKCDMLIGAKYTVEIEDYIVFKRVKCTVTGYPGIELGIKEIR